MTMQRSYVICGLSLILLVCSATGLRINKRVVEDLPTEYESGKVETTTSSLSTDEIVVHDEVVAFDEAHHDNNNNEAVEATTVGAEDGVTEYNSNGVDQRYDFAYPVTPDPKISDEGSTTIKPVPDDFNIEELENITIMNLNDTRVIAGRASCACGTPRNTKIVGGVPERINNLPWTAALVRGGISQVGRPYCGGTLINSRYVVTASHCVDGMSARGISVRLNQENVYASPNAQSYLVSRIIMHPNYNRATIDHDIALLQLSQPVRLTRDSPVVPACLPASNNINIDSFVATAAGWGATAQGGSTSSVLRKVDVPIMSNERCNRESKYNGRITENMLCAGNMEQGGKDSCQGDSGGPLIVKNGQRSTLVGVVSWGYGCAQAKAPGVYARVSRYPDWILDNTRDADWCDA